MVDEMSGARAARVSSPASTGGAGTTFEQHVAAYWLAQLLVRGIPPILVDTVVIEVCFQTEHLGWQTDDFLVVCQRPGTTQHKLLGQVKRAFTVRATDEECAKAVTDFWRDFQNCEQFSCGSDRLVLVTLRGTNTLLEHFVGLLDCARASRDGAEFEQRLAIDGFLSRKAVQYCGEIQTIIGKVQGKVIAPAELWPFLRVLHVLSLDLRTSTRQTEALIKSLLAHTAAEGDPASCAAATWNELVAVASTGMADARCYRRNDLPSVLQERHTSISTSDQHVLRSLEDHSRLILRGVRSTIGQSFQLQRSALVHGVVAALESAQVVLVTGPAGSGKSAIAKNAAELLAANHFAFAFRAEEFAKPHFDATLQAAQVSASGTTFGAILASQDRKVVLVESVERLLEKTTRDAFSDLLTLAAADRGLQIVVTCRDYSLEQVRASFLRSAGISHAVIGVPPLDDRELNEVEVALPVLRQPLQSPRLRQLLRTPYFLDKALEIVWSEGAQVPESERELRALFWREIVRADHRVPAGIGPKRAGVLQEIAVRRARALSDSIDCSDLDQTLIEHLRRDSLITSPTGHDHLVATAHDVLEDWAILQWLDEQHLAGRRSFKEFAIAIGGHPAIRRSFRKWLAELVDRDASEADRLFQAAISETDISTQFRDDTLVSLLKAPSAPSFLARHVATFLENEGAILRRLIHLLRVACVKVPEWLHGIPIHSSTLNVPDGPAWPAILRIVHDNRAHLADEHGLLLLGLIEDAARGVSWSTPDFDGSECAAGIAHWLLDKFRGYGGEEIRARLLKVIAKIPNAAPAAFETVLRGDSAEGDKRDQTAEELRGLIYAGMHGLAAARDFPDLVVSVGVEYLLASESDLGNEHRFSPSIEELDLYFGIKEGRGHDLHPPSAFSGPWMQLLRFHRAKALDYFIRVFNHSADWYAHPRLRARLEKPWEVDLTFADGSTKKQWASTRLWGLYRGTSMASDALESMLMALESWLLELATQKPDELDAVLVDILRRSDSAAVAAVVASVATANPHKSGEALLVLLSVRDYVEMDRSRVPVEPRIAGLTGMLPSVSADHELYEMERKTSNALPHRSSDLQTAIMNLQLGPLGARVHAALDRHLAAAPPKEQQTKRDIAWRLAIHRMDLRQYTTIESTGSDPAVADVPNQTRSDRQRHVRLEPKQSEPDLQAMVEEGTARLASLTARIDLLLWSLHAFRRETDKYDASQWSTRLDEARLVDRDLDSGDGVRDAPGFVAAACIRDRWAEMSQQQQGWCIDIVCAEVARDADKSSHIERWQGNSMAADRASAYVLALLLQKALSEPQMQLVRDAFAAAHTHAIDEVRKYAAWSVDKALWDANRFIALRCVNVVATEAAAADEALQAERDQDYEDRRSIEDLLDEVRKRVRADFWRDGAILDDAHSRLDSNRRMAAHALPRILAMLGRVPEDSLAVDAYARASEALVGWWASDNDHNESDVSERVQEFLMRTSADAARKVAATMLGAVDRYPRELDTVLRGLTSIEDRSPNTPRYWMLWEMFAEASRNASWVPLLGAERSRGDGLVSSLFLTAHWKDNLRHWQPLEGYAQLLNRLFNLLPPAPTVLEAYTRFLFHVGERSMPEAFVHVCSALRRGKPQEMLGRSNATALLDALLERYVYGRPLELKREEELREAVLFILDALVEAGSSAAFRMRDDFVTPP